MPPFKVCYVGPLSSGRQSSLVALAKAAESPDIVNARLLRASLNVDGSAIRFEAQANHFRGYLFYRGANDPEIPPEVSREIDDTVASDGIIAVIPCRKPRLETCEFTLARLREDLSARGRDLDDVPVVFQVTQLDYEDAAELTWVRTHLRTHFCDYVVANPRTGEGVVDAITVLLRLAGTMGSLRL